MEEIGFECAEGANVADFLTGVTVSSERKIRDGFEDSFPRNATDIRAAYEKNKIKSEMEAEYDYPSTDAAKSQTEEFKVSVKDDQANSLGKNAVQTVGFYTQVRACITRQYQIIW